jgi:hypothetical protein
MSSYDARSGDIELNVPLDDTANVYMIIALVVTMLEQPFSRSLH